MESLETKFIESLHLDESDNFNVYDYCKSKFTLKSDKGSSIYSDRPTVKLISNIIKCSSNELPKNLKIYGISARNLYKPQIILETREIKFALMNIKSIPDFSTTMKEFFINYHISGNVLFGEEKTDIDISQVKFYLKSTENNINHEFIKLQSFQELDISEESKHLAEARGDKLYEIWFDYSFQIQKIGNTDYLKKLAAGNVGKYEKYKNSILSYCNVKTKDALKFLGYKRYDYSRNYAYYEDILDNMSYFNRNKFNNFIQIENKYNKYDIILMAPGINLTYNFSNNGFLMMRSVTKYKMIRQSTYLDMYESMNGDFDKFRNKILGRYGLRTYKIKGSEKFKIDEVVMMKPQDIPFENKYSDKVGIKTIFQYYEKKYPHCKIYNNIQPIIISRKKQKNSFTNEEEIYENYFFPEFSYILGKFEDEKMDLSPITEKTAQEKFNLLCEPLKKLEHYRSNLNDNDIKKYEADPKAKNMKFELKTFESYVLKDPELQSANRDFIDLNRKKRLNIESIKANKNSNLLENWVILCLGVDKGKCSSLFYKKLVEAAKTLNIKIADPEVYQPAISEEFYKHQYSKDRQSKYQATKDFIQNLFWDLSDARKKRDEENRFEFLLTIISKEFENNYGLIKKSIFDSGMMIPSQNIKYSKLERMKDLSYFTCVLIQIFAKLCRPLWRFKPPKEYENTIIISYSVKRDIESKKTLATVFLTHDKYFNDYVFLSKYLDYDSNIFFADINNLINNGIKKVFKYKQEDDDDEFFIDNIIILREGINESQKILCKEYELNENAIKTIKNTIKSRTKLPKDEIPEPKLIILFVNDKHDTKIFEMTEENFSNKLLQKSGIENYLYNAGQKENISVKNAEVGTIINHESGITLSQKDYEFYINSAFPTVGSSNFTKYTIVYDDTKFGSSLFALMYNLCFLYFNNPQPLKIPAPLYYAIKMNRYIIDVLKFVPEEMNMSNYSL